MNKTLSDLFAHVPGLAGSFNEIFNTPAAAAAPLPPVAPPAPRDIHCVGDDAPDNSF